MKKFLWLALLSVLSPLLQLWEIITQQIRFIKAGNKIPGRPALPLLGNILQFEPNSEALYNYLFGLWKEYGIVFRFYLGPLLTINTGHQEDQEPLLSGYDYPRKGLIYLFLKPWLGTGILLSSGEKWRTRRKILTPAFHFGVLEKFIPVFNSCGDEFIRQLDKRADCKEFDVWKIVKFLTLDVICETTMGVTMNAQTNNESAYVNAANEIVTILYEYGLRPWLYPQFIFRLSSLGRRFQACLDVLHETADKIIRNRREELQKLDSWNTAMDIDELGRRRRVALLDMMLLATRDGTFTDTDIRTEVDSLLFGGHESTAAAISFTLYLLSLHEDVQNKIIEELESVFDVSNSLDFNLKQLSELKYTEMVIKESLRIYPPIPAVARHLTKDYYLRSKQVMVPKGAEIFTDFHLLHKNPEVFPDPDKFDPERFTTDECARRHPFAYLPFSAGPRNCLGQKFAMLEMKTIIAKVVWNFHILPDPSFTPILIWEIILKTKNGIRLKLKRRTR